MSSARTNRTLGRRGILLSQLMTGVFVAALVFAVAVAFSQLGKGRLLSKGRAKTHTSVVAKLQALYNLPTKNPGLKATLPGLPHTDGNFEWEVADLTPRLKRITLRSKVSHPLSGVASSETVGQIGYRYDDF